MNAKQALAKAQSMWGKTAGVQDNGKRLASTPEQRFAARQARAELKGFIVTREDRRFFRDFDDSLFSQSVRNRFSVGSVEHGGMFFLVKGQGDSWEEAFDKAANWFRTTAA